MCLSQYSFLSRYKQVGRDGTESESGTPGSESGTQNSTQHQHQQFLGDASCAIPNFGCVEFSNPLPSGITAVDIRTFEQLYKEHSEVCRALKYMWIFWLIWFINRRALYSHALSIIVVVPHRCFLKFMGIFLKFIYLYFSLICFGLWATKLCVHR